MKRLTHIDASGNARMVNVSGKPVTSRTATATGCVRMSGQTLDAIIEGQIRKGDVLAAARLAGIMGAKRTSDLVPLCHPLPIDGIMVELTPDRDLPGIRIEATVTTSGRTGVEMEALTAVSTAALTIYDMAKAIERSMQISEIRLTFKDGGKSGRYEAK
ncbi:MAG: cyclic pyranopterin monophosphate synthase MoaC [Rhodobacter sp.]|nr:cyclic pyranopterin monophosphate synthase MoaC [Rhodobacter sp.]